jgi:O-acetyl-ADP-ribose deacetylase (regulator of RNase III)
MGKGIAVEFRRRFPAMFEEYRERCRDGRFGLGEVFAWEQDDVVVFNLGTQKTWRTKATLEAVRTALRGMIAEAEERGLVRIGLPRVGAGLGGLDWSLVRKEIEDIAKGTNVELVVFEEFEAGKRVAFG